MIGVIDAWRKRLAAGTEFRPVNWNGASHDLGRGTFLTGGADADLRNEASKFDRIDRNHFRNFARGEGNGYETLRLGRGRFSHSSGHTLVDHNLFEECSGEIEIISVKSDDNVIRNNTFLNSHGEITLRNCHRVLVEGNFMLNPAEVDAAHGVRAYGTGHRIVNNYFEDLTGPAIVIRTGDIEMRWRSEWMFRETYGDDFNFKMWGGYHVPVDIQVAHNTAVNSERAILIGDSREKEKYPRPPRGIQIANNMFHVKRPTMIQIQSDPLDWHWANNIFYSTADGSELGMDLAEHEARIVDPLLESDGAFKRLSASSPAIGAASSLREMLREDAEGHEPGARMRPLRAMQVVTRDIHGRSRADAPTIGTEEPGDGPHRRPLTPADVGPDAPQRGKGR